MIHGSASTLELLSTGELHLALTLHQPERAACSRLIAEVPLLAIGKASGRPRTSRRELRDLAGERLLLLTRGFGSRDLFDAACRVSGLHPNIYLESAASPTLLAFARAGLGVAVIPATISANTEGLDVQPIVTRDALLEARLALQWNPERILPGYAQRFIDEIAVEAHRTYSRGAARGPRRKAAGAQSAQRAKALR